MPLACGRVKPADQRPPLEKDVNTLPHWLTWSIPVIHQSLKHNGSSAPVSAARGSRRLGPRALMRTWKGREEGLGCTGGGTALRYPSRLPPDMDFRRIGFVPLETPLPSTAPPPPSSSSTPPPVSAPSSPSPCSPCSPAPSPDTPSPSSSADHRPPSPPAATTLSSIGQRYGTFARLGRLAGRAPAPCRSREERREEGEAGGERGGEERAEERGDEELGDKERGEGEQEEEGWTHPELPFRLVLSDSSPSHAGSVAPNDDDRGDPEEKVGGLRYGESEDQRETDILAFAQDYTNRLCQCVSLAPDRAERLLRALEQFERDGDRACPVELYGRLAAILDRWPQVLRDYAAFLTPTQAQDCGLVAEQRLFERSRTFLRHLEHSLGPDSAPFQEVVSVLQGSSAPDPSDISKISSLLKDHAHLQEEFWVFFKDLHGARPLPPPQAVAPAQPSETTTTEARDSVSQNAPNRTRKRTTIRQHSKTNRRKGGGVQQRGEEEENREIVAKEEEQRKEKLELPFCDRNISVTTTTEKVTVWTREEDRAILTACRQGGANRKTFRQVSTQLGNKTVNEVSDRFRHLIQLFHSASHKPSSCSVDHQPISSQEAAPD